MFPRHADLQHAAFPSHGLDTIGAEIHEDLVYLRGVRQYCVVTGQALRSYLSGCGE